MALQIIDKERYKKVLHLYFLWKELNATIKEDYSRGINLPEAITEPICCYVNDYELSLGAGSEDAINTKNNNQVQIKATSNWNSDLTSFGPESKFDELHFVRLNQSEDKMYLYEIPINELKTLKVNKNDTFEEQQRAGRRPRFSIIANYIVKYKINHYAVVDLVTGEITK